MTGEKRKRELLEEGRRKTEILVSEVDKTLKCGVIRLDLRQDS